MVSDAALAGALEQSRVIFDQLDQHWVTDQGMHRPGFSALENDALQIIACHAQELGCEAYQDLAGNAYFILPGQQPELPVFMMGSHLDAVPNGGRYDGPAGVVAGFAAMHAIHNSNIRPERTTVLAAIRAEESPWFKRALIGSSMACGLTGPDILNLTHQETEQPLSVHMNECHLDVAALTNKLTNRDPLIPLDRIACFMEAHIEQGPGLADSGHQLGIGTKIRGNVRFPEMMTIFGEAAHSGATPQHLRQDAIFAAASVLVAYERLCKRIARSGRDIVYTAADIHAPDSSATSVSKQCDFLPEARSTDPSVLQNVQRWFLQNAKAIVKRRGLTVGDNFSKIRISDPVALCEAVQNFSFERAGVEGLNVRYTPVGAGHDAMNFQAAGVPSGMILIPHGRNGISHNPAEIMTLQPGDDPFVINSPFSGAVRHFFNMAVSIQKMPGVRSTPNNNDFAQQLLNHGARPL